MSIRYNGEKIAGKYKSQTIYPASESEAGIIQIASSQEVKDGTDNSKAVTPRRLKANYATKEELAEKQNVILDINDIRTNAKTGADLAPQVAVNTQRIEDLTTARIPDVIYHGTPHIVGGQVSNYSNTNYLQFPFTDISRSQPFDIYFSFTTAEDITTQQNIIDSYFGIALAIQNGKGIMALSSNGSNWDIGSATGINTLLPNTTYYVKYSWTGTQYTAALSTNDTEYVPDMSLNSSLSPHKGPIYIGGSPDLFGPNTAHPFKGIINFSKSKVVVNNNVVWEGMADVGIASRANTSLTNLDEAGEARFNAKQDKLTEGSAISLEDDVVAVELFDRSKFTVAGTPAITNDGIASGFSRSNYLRTPVLNLNGNFRIKMLINIGNYNSTGFTTILAGDATNVNGRGCWVYVDSNHKLVINLSSDGTTWSNIGISTSTNVVQLNTDYLLEFYFDGNTYKADLNNINYCSVISQVPIHSIDNASFTLAFTHINTPTYFTGSIDLSQFSITVDGVEVFNGAQTIYQALDKKQDVITDLTVIRDGASKGATAIQNTNDCVHKTGNETISGVKTFSNAGYGYGGVTINNTDGGASCVKFMSAGVKKGLIGIDANEKPIFENATTGSVSNLVRSTRDTAIGSTSKPVYINANGIAQPITVEFQQVFDIDLIEGAEQWL